MQNQNLSHEFADQIECDMSCAEKKAAANLPNEYQNAFPAGTAAGKDQHYPPNNLPAINLVNKNVDLADQHLKHFQGKKEEHLTAPQKELITKASKQQKEKEGLDRNIPAPEGPSSNIGMQGIAFSEKNPDKLAGNLPGNQGNVPANAPTPNMSIINVKPGQGTGAPSQDPQHIAGGYAGGVDTKHIAPQIQTEELKSQSAPQQKELLTKASRMDDKKLDELAQPSGNYILGQQSETQQRTTAKAEMSNPADKIKEGMHKDVLKHQDNAKPDYGRARGEQGQSYSEKGVDKLPQATGYGREHNIYP